ncbi:MAG: serine/threonine-protein kinase [Candidatus Eiseniibacteriota bacterium]
MVSRTPFGNPDGSRSDIQEVMNGFVTFEQTGINGGLGLRPDDLSIRVIVGAKGSGKTVYLRRLRAAAAGNESVYADMVQQDLPSTSNIVKFCQCFGKNELTEKWMQLWYAAIMRSLVTHLLHARQLSPYLTEPQREELEDYPAEVVPRRRREVSVYSQVTDIVQAHHTARAFSRYFDHPAWAELSSTVNDIIADMPPIYFFIDSVDEEYASAPMYWLQCQKGLFFRAMRFLRDQHFGGRLHVIVCVRDHVLASVLRSEHQNRYRGEPHIVSLGWEYPNAEYFLKQKIARLEPDELIRDAGDGPPTVDHWLGSGFIENRGRSIQEPTIQYLLRHTRLLPRDIVILGNKLSQVVAQARAAGRRDVPQPAIRQCVREVARSFGNEQLAICANHIASSGMPSDAARMGYDDVYTGDSEYARGLVDDLRSVVSTLGKDRFDAETLAFAGLEAAQHFGESSDALSVLWQNRLLGYLDETPDGPNEVFFSELNCDHFTLPLDREEYLLHSCMIDCVGIQAVRHPVGQGAMQVDPAGGAGTRPGATPSRIGIYSILGVIGGGMGTVYLAMDPRLGRQVALKKLPDGVTDHATAVARFEREARVLATLNHPHIATIYSFESAGGEQFFTMEYVQGQTLARCIEAGPLPLDRALRLFRQIAVGLDAAHRRGVVHRDLKPANIMVSRDDGVKILDFGIAKVMRRPTGEAIHPTGTTRSAGKRLTTSGSVMGTIGYMSPEQVRGLPVDHRSDIWAFGCCLYECLTGLQLFRGMTLIDYAAAIMAGWEPDWHALTAAPEPIARLIRGCLEPDCERRLAHIADAIGMIDAARASGSTPEPTTG